MSQPINIPNNNNNSRRDRLSLSSSADSDSSFSHSESSSSPPLHTPRDRSPLAPLHRNPVSVSVSSTSPILSYFFPPSANRLPPSPDDEKSNVNSTTTTTTTPLQKHARRMSTPWGSGVGVASGAATVGFAPTPNVKTSPAVESRQERAEGLLRRLSLSSAFTRPSIRPPLPGPFASPTSPTEYNNPPPPPPPPSLASPTSPASPSQSDTFTSPAIPSSDPSPLRKTRRSATVNLGSPATASTGTGTGTNAGLKAPANRIRRAPSPMGERMLKGHFDGW